MLREGPVVRRRRKPPLRPGIVGRPRPRLVLLGGSNGLSGGISSSLLDDEDNLHVGWDVIVLMHMLAVDGQ